MSCPKGTTKICKYEGAVGCDTEDCPRTKMGSKKAERNKKVNIKGGGKYGI